MAVAAAIYLATLGHNGLRQVAELCWHRSHYAAAEIAKLPGYRVDRSKPFFQEFVVDCPRPVKELNVRLLNDHGIIGHPQGVAAGVASMREAWEAAVAGVALDEYARQRPALRAALDKFGRNA